MPLHGKGMLVVFNEVTAADERDFNEWYNREHIDERINLPGFRRARRYVAVRGSPKYVATYECDSVEDLATTDYLHMRNSPTPWTQSVTGRFTHLQRLAVRVQVDMAHGVGGVVGAVRFVPDRQQREPLTAWLRGTAFPKAIARPGMVGAAAGENDPEITRAGDRGESTDQAKAEEVEWVVLLEGGDAGTVGAAARSVFTLTSLKKFGVSVAPVIGTYRLLFGNQR
jgi:hypothetical protein